MHFPAAKLKFLKPNTAFSRFDETQSKDIKAKTAQIHEIIRTLKIY